MGKNLKPKSKTTDTASNREKTALRLYFLRKYHKDDARVFDACQGSGLVWQDVRQFFDVTTYWGVDQKHAPGRLKMDSARILEQGLSDNVVDIDTYGSPWSHFLAMLPNVHEPTTVFLTHGKLNLATLPTRVQRLIGVNELRCPQILKGRLWSYATKMLLSQPRRHGLDIIEAKSVQPTHTVVYYGLHLRPKKK